MDGIRVRAQLTQLRLRLFVARKTARACLVSENLFPNFTDCLKIEFQQKTQLAEKLI